MRRIVGLLLIVVSVAAVIVVFKAQPVTMTTTITTIRVLTGYRAGLGLVLSTLGLVLFAAGVTMGLMLIMPSRKRNKPKPGPQQESGSEAN